MASYKSGKRLAENVTTDSDSEIEVTKKRKRVDFNELFSIKLSPYHKYHCAITNGKAEKDNILFVNIRDGYSVYGAGKGLVLGYQEIVHIEQHLNYTEPLPKYKATGLRLTGKPKNGKYEFTRQKGDKKTILNLPITVIAGLHRIIPSIRFIMETIIKLGDEKQSQIDEFVRKVQKAVMVYIKDLEDNNGDFTKADLRKMCWIYTGLIAYFNIPVFDNPYEPSKLGDIYGVKVDDEMQTRITEVIDYVIIKVFI